MSYSQRSICVPKQTHRVFLRTHLVSRGIERDKLEGTNGAKFAVFRRFSLIFADPGNYSISEAQIFGDFRRKPQKTAKFCRNRFVLFSLSLSIPPYSFATELSEFSLPKQTSRNSPPPVF